LAVKNVKVSFTELLTMKFSNYSIKFILISTIFFVIIGCGPPPTLEEQRASQQQTIDTARRLKELQDLGLIKLY